MASLYKIPLSGGVTDQEITIALGGDPYKLRVLWNEIGGYFSLSISTLSDDPILTNIKMVRDYPLISKFKDSRLPYGDMLLIKEKGTSSRPGYDDLGDAYNLYYYLPDSQSIQARGNTVGADSDAYIGSVWDDGSSVWDGGESDWDN